MQAAYVNSASRSPFRLVAAALAVAAIAAGITLLAPDTGIRILGAGLVVAGSAGCLGAVLRGQLTHRRGAHPSRLRVEAPSSEPSERHMAASGVLADLGSVTARRLHPLGGGTTLVTRLRTPPEAMPIVQILSSQISRRHASISYRAGGYWIEDHESVNGTWLNDRRLDRPRRLQNGDVVRFYNYEFEFQATTEMGCGPSAGGEGARSSGAHPDDTEILPAQAER